jgi:X-Pro dipeptidyl-peptidase
VLSLSAVVGPAVAAPLPDGPGTPAPAAAPSVPQHIDTRTKSTEPVYDYANAIRESVYVDTTMDTDSDGENDEIAVDIVRPSETALTGVKIPVIMDASPYYSCCGRGNESEKKTYDGDGVIRKMPLFYDNYFVPRGYAMVGVDIVGTGRSTGCGDVGGSDEIQSVVDVIDWLNGRNTAHTANGQPVKASWTTGAVGMIGKSYDGTLANGVAATGVPGLKTIVPISAISSWYDYTRSGGVPYSDDYMPWLAGYVGHDSAACDEVRGELGDNDDDETGDYTSFWAERDYTENASKVKASVFITHGLSDYNVQTNHFSQWWSALSRNNVPRKLWLGLEDHVDPFEFRRDEWVDELHKWFDYWLQGLQNGVMDTPQATIQREDGSFVDEARWPAVGARPTTLQLSKLSGTSGPISFTGTDKESVDTVVLDPTAARTDRAVFLSDELSKAVRVSGTGKVSVRVKVNKVAAGIKARLVDYGTANRYVNVTNVPDTRVCWGDGNALDTGCYADTQINTAVSDTSVVVRTLADVGHYKSLYTKESLRSDRWYDLSFELNADDVVFAAGHRLSLVLTVEPDNPSLPFTGATITLDPTRSSLTLPLTSYTSSLQTAEQARVPSTRLAQPEPEKNPAKLMQQMVEASR